MNCEECAIVTAKVKCPPVAELSALLTHLDDCPACKTKFDAKCDQDDITFGPIPDDEIELCAMRMMARIQLDTESRRDDLPPIVVVKVSR